MLRNPSRWPKPSTDWYIPDFFLFSVLGHVGFLVMFFFAVLGAVL